MREIDIKTECVLFKTGDKEFAVAFAFEDQNKISELVRKTTLNYSIEPIEIFQKLKDRSQFGAFLIGREAQRNFVTHTLPLILKVLNINPCSTQP